MNVQDVIERALAGNDGIPVTPVEHTSCDDVQVEKLASALNFIGANLESSIAELEKEAALPSAPVSPPPVSPSFMSQHGKKLGYGAGGLALSGLAAYGVKKYRDRKKAESKSKDEEKKTASVDDVLYYAAQVGKQALLEKVAEDRINPAKISAGPADPYSGEIMPNAGQVSNEFVGNTRDHHALIALKAQKVRNRINKDMKQYVTNVGDGYNLQGHLSKMNK